MPAGYPKDKSKRQVWNGSDMTSLSVERREISFLQGIAFIAIAFPAMIVVAYLTLEAMAEHDRLYQECGYVYCKAEER